MPTTSGLLGNEISLSSRESSRSRTFGITSGLVWTILGNFRPLSGAHWRIAVFATPVVAFAMIFGAPGIARSEPITLSGVLLGWIISRGLNSVFDSVTGVRQMQRELDELAKSDRRNAAEIRRLRNELNESMTRKEVEKVLLDSLARIDKTLAEHAARIKAVEDEVAELNAENARLHERVGIVEKRLTEAEKTLLLHELRIRDLEAQVAALGASGIKSFRSGKIDNALREFDNAISKDPTDPGLYFGRALVLKHLGRDREAEQAVSTGLAARRLRSPGNWYRRTIEGVQGPERIWLETQKQAAPVKTNSGA